MRSRFSRRLVRRLAIGAASLLATVAIVVVMTRQPEDLVRVRTDAVTTQPLAETLRQNFNPFDDSDVAIDIPTMAALAANVYQPQAVYDPTCTPGKPGRIPLVGWEQLTSGWSYPRACNAAMTGLHYEVWVKMDQESRLFVVVVFRGTVPGMMVHWCSNLRNMQLAVCDPLSDQYLQIAPLINSILEGQYDEWGPDRYTILVGHSLGGGLAELAARSSYVKQVFGFDSSPVVGRDAVALLRKAFANPDDLTTMSNDYELMTGCSFDPIIAPESRRLTVRRVYEHGEGLAYIRLFKRWLNIDDDDESTAIEYRTNLLTGGIVEQHQMKALACAMRSRLMDGQP